VPAEHEESLGTVIRHPVDHATESDSEADMSEMPEIEEDELESELQALKEDFEEPSQFVDIRNQTRNASGHPLRAPSIVKRPTSKGSAAAASSLSSKRSRADDSSPRTSKAVRFNKGAEQEDEGVPDLPQIPQAPQAAESAAETSVSDSSDSSVSSDSDSDDDSDDDSSSEVEPAAEAPSDSDSDSSSEESDSSDSDSDEEAPPPVQKVQTRVSVGAPGEGSIRTKKSNNRIKLRRRLSKLKQLGALPQQAGFEALRAWEETHGGWHTPEQYPKPEPFVQPQQPVEPEQESTESSIKRQKREKKEEEQKEFEAKRQKLLRDLASGNGVDVDEISEKENVPPAPSAVGETPVSEEVPGKDRQEQEPPNRRTLDIASSRRMLFGSLGMRTPKTKEDEEETRRKLAAKASAFGRRDKPSKQEAQEETEQMQEDEDASDIDWQNKLVVRAVECLYPQVDMTAPPYPFVQRWDQEANASIRELKGPSKKRKRKQRVQVYEGYEEQEEYDENGNYYGHDDQANHEGYYEGEAAPYYEGHYAGEAEGDQINYDDAPEPEQAIFDDLPSIPADISSVPDLTESEAKVGAIIAFRQLDMSKATNWQPQMSEYRVAEVRSVKDQGVINVLLAKRDRKSPPASDDEPRQFSKFEMPDLANDEGEDDGYRELTFAELSDPKLLQPAARSGAGSQDQNNTREGSMSVK
jgi:hypothetical protein